MAKKPKRLDYVDRKILNLLLRNARTPFLEIAKEVNLSGAAIHQRVKRLEGNEVIVGYQTKVNHQAIGKSVRVFIGITPVKKTQYSTLVRELIKIPEIVEGYYTTGNITMLCKVHCKDNEELKHLLIDKLPKIKDIQSTITYVSLEQFIDRPLQLDEYIV